MKAGINETSANSIYDLLIEAGAAPSYREQFVYSVSDPHHVEWRFQGKFGFGGKFWSQEWRISMYPEDRTPERIDLAEQINKRLAEMRVEAERLGIIGLLEDALAFTTCASNEQDWCGCEECRDEWNDLQLRFHEALVALRKATGAKEKGEGK